MRLPFLRPREPKVDRPRAAAATDEPAAIAAARTRARQRLVGALVLLVVGVIGFPILFETQPRALPMNTPIVVQGADAGRPALMPDAPAVPVKPVPPPPLAARTLPPSDAGIEATPPAASAPTAASASALASSPALASVPPMPAAPLSSPAKRAPSAASAAPASAPSAPASEPAKGNRFVVQVGAFSDATALRDVRQKVEKLGFKTYTQVIEAEGVKRTRVRVGPYATRDEADAAAAKLKRGGLAPAVLAL